MATESPANSVFDKVPAEMDFPSEERAVLALWKEKDVFARSLDERRGGPTFVFYEGPPTANGLPHNGHVLTRVIKDLFPRYKTMKGFYVPRKAGWDTHGLPVEVEVEKELRIHGKEAIEAYGVEPFIAKCIDSVFRYTDDWEKLTERVGFWVDLPSAYVTYHQSYVESVWWALSELFKKNLLYRGNKVVWWWAQGGTALSSGEVGQGYKQVDDPSVYVAFPMKDEPDVSLLVWTTTPWTLPSNMYAAVNPKYEYVQATANGKKLIVAKGLVDTLAKKLGCPLEVERELDGKGLIGREFTPPFDLYASAGHRFRVIAADFVTLDAGTGIVHIAPAFGEDDFQAHKKESGGSAGSALLCAVKPDGTFIPELTKYAGRWVKDCDKEIQRELDERGLLVFAEQYRHDYPFCWRSDNDPLIQYARPAWYIKTTALKDQAIANNQKIQWLPDHIKDGRFGDFLANNVDWALSRERYWGTPLNIWINDVTGKMAAPASVAEILEKNPKAFDHFSAARQADPKLNPHLIVHKPWIDQVTWQEPGEQGTYRRVPEVIDCWFDSGCMPFAQWGFPHQGHVEFNQSFPADFISEAIDQTRGWFYSLLMISTLVFDEAAQKRLGVNPVRTFPHPFKTCIVLGHVSDKEGKKESKSKGNYTPPDVILDEVQMDFAVWEPSDSPAAAKVLGSSVAIAREDFEGLDLSDGAKVKVFRADSKQSAIEVAVVAVKGLPRRVVVLGDALREQLGVVRTSRRDVKPVEVPRLPVNERVVLWDPSTPAPGADAFRWFFYASNPPWNATRHSLSNVRALQKETLIKLRNVYSFFTIYANIDHYDPADDSTIGARRGELDKWIASELAITVEGVTADLDAYDVYAATGKIAAFVDALSNWYVRRSRERFWHAGWTGEKRSAYDTLHDCLVVLAKVMAPFTPFMSEAIYQNLVVGPAKRTDREVPDSVHLVMFPTAYKPAINRALSTKMLAVRGIVSLGLQVRTQAKLKVRQPLRAAHVVLAGARGAELATSLATSAAMIKDELNVLELTFVPEAEVRTFVEYKLKPNFRTLGQRGLGKQAQELKRSMSEIPPAQAAQLVADLMGEGKANFGGVELLRDDVEIAFETKEGYAAAGDKVGVVVIDTRLDAELRDLGLVRELLNRIQGARKEMELEYTERIRVAVQGSERVHRVVTEHADDIAREVLANLVSMAGPPEGARVWDGEIEGEAVVLAVSRA